MTLQSGPRELADVSLSQMAYDRIENMIVTGQLPPNTLISENELSRDLGYGRTPIREALQRLRFTGLVDVLPRRGILVKPVDILSQLDLLAVRRPLEELMVRLASKRANSEERTQMLALADLLERTTDSNIVNPDQVNIGHLLEINRTAHLLEAKASRNEMLEKSIGMIYSLSRRFWYANFTDIASFSEASKWHRRMLRAIAGGEIEEAVDGARNLIDFLETATREAIEERYRKIN